MKRYISHWTAAKFWQVPYLEHFFTEHLNGPEEYTVFEPGHRTYGDKLMVHVCAVPLPSTATHHVNDTPVVSPAFLFVQCCLRLNITLAIILGCLLCSPLDGHPALTSVAEIRDFIMQISYVWGRTRALDALKYIKDDFESVMEIMNYILVDLPSSLGGFGIQEEALINARIPISKREARQLNQVRNYLKPDLLYPEHRLIIEYYGHESHSSPEAVSHDQIREAILRKKGYRVIVVRASDIYNPQNLHRLYQRLEETINKTLRITTPHYKPRLTFIHSLRPRADTTAHHIPAPLPHPRDRELNTFFYALNIKERVR